MLSDRVVFVKRSWLVCISSMYDDDERGSVVVVSRLL